jgi:hypothetical protein
MRYGANPSETCSDARYLAVDAVSSEPVSVRISLKTGYL